MNDEQHQELLVEVRALRGEVRSLNQALQDKSFSAGEIANVVLLCALFAFIAWLLWVKVIGKNFYRGAKESLAQRHLAGQPPNP